jgi:outer membrane protein OmpA-like peptidoglycan-associated protein
MRPHASWRPGVRPPASWQPGVRPIPPRARRQAIRTIGQLVRRARRIGARRTAAGRLPVFRSRAAGRNFRILARPRAGLRHEILSIEQELGGMEMEAETPRGNACKQKWEQLLKTMPQEVKDALHRMKHDAATVFAIHYGIRDLNLLTRLRFFSKHGLTRGYCALKRNDPADTKLWNEERTAVRGFLARPSPPLAQKGGIKCTKQAVVRDVPRPDNPPGNITGRYEYRDSRGRPIYTVNINQAGRHIEAMRVPVLYVKHKRGRTARRLQGDLQPDGSFTFFGWKSPDYFGHFRYKDDNHLHLEQEGEAVVDKYGATGERQPPVDHKLIKISSRPTLTEMAFHGTGFPRDGLVHRSEWYPLTQMQIDHLKNTLKAENVAKFLLAHFSAPARSRALDPNTQGKVAEKFNHALAKVFEDPLRGVHLDDVLLARFYARTILTNNKWTFNRITRSQIDWIQIMVDLYSIGSKAAGYSQAKLGSIEKYLGLTASAQHPKPGEAPHKYKVTLKLTGVTAVVLSGYRGTITIEKISGTKWNKPEKFQVGFSGLAVAAKIAIGDETEGTGESYIDWRPADFPGDVRLVTGSLGGVAKAGFMHVFGQKHLPPMHVTFAGLDVAKPELGVGLEGLLGRIHDKPLPAEDLSRTIVDEPYDVAYGLKDDVHFCFGSALLTPDARQALRILCANELPAFMAPTSRLRIVGHTDPVNTDEFNLKLSKLRAENTLQAIKDILGTSFRITDVTATGEGEVLARKDKLPQDKPDPRYRRVDVILNSRLVLRLRA